MAVNWIAVDALLHEAECRSEGGVIVRLLVEGLIGHCWVWQAYEQADIRPMRHGATDTLDVAKVRAQAAMVELVRERERAR